MKLTPLEAVPSEALLDLWNGNVDFDALQETVFAEKIWEDVGYDPDLAFLLQHEGEAVGFIVGVIRARPEGPMGYVKLLVVEQEYHRNGLGGQLLTRLEEGFRQRGIKKVRLFESAPNYLQPGLDPRYTKALLFFEKHGYERFGETYNLRVPLRPQHFDPVAAEITLSENHVAVRRARPGDREAVLAFLREYWPAWQAECTRMFANDPISLHLAFRGEQLLGFSGYDGNNVGTGWFGPMGTAPAARGLGIGGILLRRCLQDMKDQGHRAAVIPWVGPVGFYAHYADAWIERVFYRYEKTL